MEIDGAGKKWERLKGENAAYAAQAMLLDSFVAMARSPLKGGMLNQCLQQTLEIAIALTGAEKGSIFLFDKGGKVTDSILTRRAPAAEQSDIIGSIMDRGLAGWVRRHRVCGVVQDADADERWLSLADQPYAVGSALAVPILRREAMFGILTLLHSRKAFFDQASIETMRGTADQIALVLDNVKLYLELTEAKTSAEAYSRALHLELEKGRKIQRDFLPPRLPRVPQVEIAAAFIPALQVSGDFYDAFTLPGNNLGLVLGDVSDKGVGAALYMALIRSFIRMFAQRYCEEARGRTAAGRSSAGVSEELQRSAMRAMVSTNDYLVREHDAEGMFATVFYGVVHPQTGVLRYVNAGHPPFYVIAPEGGPVRLNATGPAVGLQKGFDFPSKRKRIAPGALLFGYTDGVTETFSATGEMYGQQRLEAAINRSPLPSAKEIIDWVLADVRKFMAGTSPFDDIAMLAVKLD